MVYLPLLNMKRYRKLGRLILTILPYLIVFVASLYSPSDPDLGWHLKYGEYFFKTGHILRDNIFSVLMPDYHWVNHSWGTDILTYAVFHPFGFFGITILGALVITATFYFFSRAARLSLWDETLLFPLTLYYLDPVNNISFRPQLISLLLLGILFYIISLSERRNKKFLFLTIPLFFLWANLHGEFILGLGIFFIWIVISAVRQIWINKMKIDSTVFQSVKIPSLAFFFSILSSLINPFGVGVYLETFRHFGNPMQKHIAEWLPLQQLSNLWWMQITMGILILFGIIFFYFNDKFREKLPYIVIALLFFVLPFWARRYAWPAYYLMWPVLVPLTIFFKPSTKKSGITAVSVILPLLLVLVFVIKYPLRQYTAFSWNEYCQSTNLHCSPKSVYSLQKVTANHKLISLYGWGGWLIWNYPEIKPTIDGRMSFWKDEKGYSGFKEYYWLEQNLDDIEASKYDLVYMSPDKPLFKRMLQLVDEGKWSVVYRDRNAGIFVRNTFKSG